MVERSASSTGANSRIMIRTRPIVRSNRVDVIRLENDMLYGLGKSGGGVASSAEVTPLRCKRQEES